jgi:nucleoid-associated protein YgaU
MGLKEEWQQLPGNTKMMIVGGGGLAIYFLYTAIRNKNASQTQGSSQDTSTGPQTEAIDPASSIDASTQQMQQMIGGIQDSLSQYSQATQQSNQQNMQALQQIVQQSQQSTIQQIQAITSKMSSTPIYKPVSTPKPTPVIKKTPEPPKPAHVSIPKQSAKTAPKTETVTVKSGNNLWTIAKNDFLAKGASNAAIQREVNTLAKANHISNPNRINVGQKITGKK